MVAAGINARPWRTKSMCSSSEGSHSREVYSADRCDEICDVVRTNMNYTLHELRDICSWDRKAFKADKADRARVTNLLKVAEDDRPKGANFCAYS